MPPDSRIFKALAHDVRLRIMSLLSQRRLCVCHLEAALALSQVAVSRHLGVLRAAGLVESQREGLWVHYRLAKPQSELERVLFAWLRSRARADERLREDLKRMRECVQMPLVEVAELVHR